MTLRRSQPVRFTPAGATDTLDGTNTPPGSMQALTNLIPDPTTRGQFYARPASVLQTSFGSFSSPGFVSLLKVIGTRVYGMIASAATPGFDEPFCFDLSTGLFIAVTGVSGANVPANAASSGAWEPPTADMVGVYLVVTHPGFTGAGGLYFGWFDLTNPAAPTWDAGNTATNALPEPPRAVAQFFNRAYFACGNALVPTVALDPLDCDAAAFAATLILGDDTDITALKGLPLANQLGGIIQSLIAFKDVSVMYQVTGDPALTSNPLTLNSLNVATGTLGPNTITPTPKGLAFISPEGLRIIDFNATVSDPIGTSGFGITVPFIYSNVPSRMVAAYGSNVIRVSSQNAGAVGSPQQEWWYDMVRGIWTGPHTFASSLIQPYRNSFVKTPIGVTAKLFTSDIVQSSTSTFVENSAQMTFLWQTSLLPDSEQMAANSIIEQTINLALAAGLSVTVSALDQFGNVLDSVSIHATGATTVWDAFTWDAAVWDGALNALSPRQIAWTQPIVFNKLSVAMAGNCVAGFRIGTLYMRYEILGYIQQTLAG